MQMLTRDLFEIGKGNLETFEGKHAIKVRPYVNIVNL